jgi:phytoene synthase
MPAESFTHATEVLRAGDHDRYLSTLVLDAAHRGGVTALSAFNADIAAIRDRVSNPAPGEVRLQWWSDALTGEGHGAVRQHPTADALLQTVERYNIPTGTLLRLIGARRFDLYDDPMPDLQTFEGYAGETNSTLYQLAAMILNDGAQIETGNAAGHLGVAHALIGHLRAFGYVSAQGRIMLPWTILEANGVQEREIFSRMDSEGLHEALGQIAELAAGHLDKAQSAIALLPGKLKPAFAMIAILRTQLAALGSRTGTSFEPVPDDLDWQKIARLTWWTLRNR